MLLNMESIQLTPTIAKKTKTVFVKKKGNETIPTRH